jgi:DNA mismatch repair ATPase MutS
LSQFDEELFKHADMAEVPVVMAVVVSYVDGQRMVGLAFVDAATRHMGACEFHDDDHFCSLEAAVVQLGAKECVLVKVRPHQPDPMHTAQPPPVHPHLADALRSSAVSRIAEAAHP